MIFFMLLLTPILHDVVAQNLEVKDLTDNHGYLPIKLKDVEIINNHLKIIHIINTTQYLETVNVI